MRVRAMRGFGIVGAPFATAHRVGKPANRPAMKRRIQDM